nr:MAG TPA: FAM91 C-terminus [Caudoviricetes sp.]
MFPWFQKHNFTSPWFKVFLYLLIQFLLYLTNMVSCC